MAAHTCVLPSSQHHHVFVLRRLQQVLGGVETGPGTLHEAAMLASAEVCGLDMVPPRGRGVPGDGWCKHGAERLSPAFANAHVSGTPNGARAGRATPPAQLLIERLPPDAVGHFFLRVVQLLRYSMLFVCFC